jgi:hypothetical protein
MVERGSITRTGPISLIPEDYLENKSTESDRSSLWQDKIYFILPAYKELLFGDKLSY